MRADSQEAHGSGHATLRPHDDIIRVAQPIMVFALRGAERAHRVEDHDGALIVPAAKGRVKVCV